MVFDTRSVKISNVLTTEKTWDFFPTDPVRRTFTSLGVDYMKY